MHTNFTKSVKDLLFLTKENLPHKTQKVSQPLHGNIIIESNTMTCKNAFKDSYYEEKSVPEKRVLKMR